MSSVHHLSPAATALTALRPAGIEPSATSATAAAWLDAGRADAQGLLHVSSKSHSLDVQRELDRIERGFIDALCDSTGDSR